MQPFVHFSIMFSLYMVLQNRNSKSSNFLIFHISGGISSRPASFSFLIFFFFVLIEYTFLV